MEISELIHNFVMEEDVFIPSLIAGSILIGITVKSVASVFINSSRERTKREIAAFVAEGSMTPEQGERLATAGRQRGSCT